MTRPLDIPKEPVTQTKRGILQWMSLQNVLLT